MAYGRAKIRFAPNGRDVALTLDLSVPGTPAEMERGLQGFEAFGPDQGMLFMSRIWPHEEKIPMWQASVAVPLAMIWLSAAGSVRDIELVNPGDPRTFDYEGMAVVECHAEVAMAAGIEPGTTFALERIPV